MSVMTILLGYIFYVVYLIENMREKWGERMLKYMLFGKLN